MSYATLTKQCINIKHTWKILFFRIPSKNNICDKSENKLRSGEHILIISMTNAIRLRDIYTCILNLPTLTNIYLHTDIYIPVNQWYEFKSRQGKNTNLTVQISNYNTVWFNFQTHAYIYLQYIWYFDTLHKCNIF